MSKVVLTLLGIAVWVGIMAVGHLLNVDPTLPEVVLVIIASAFAGVFWRWDR